MSVIRKPKGAWSSRSFLWRHWCNLHYCKDNTAHSSKEALIGLPWQCLELEVHNKRPYLKMVKYGSDKDHIH